MLVPDNMDSVRLREWATACLLASSYAHDVLSTRGQTMRQRVQLLRDKYQLSAVDARRDLETIENWLSELAPELLPASENQ